jgi:hypothetical protein
MLAGRPSLIPCCTLLRERTGRELRGRSAPQCFLSAASPLLA